MDALKAIASRRSVRRYRAESVPAETVDRIVDCGRLAATARNLQPVRFVVVTEPAARAAIAALAPNGPFIAEAPVCIAVFAENVPYYLEDGAAATQNMLVAAAALGLGSCWVAGDKKPYADAVRTLLGVPEGMRLVSLAAVGRPADVPNPPKKPLAEVLHRERW